MLILSQPLVFGIPGSANLICPVTGQFTEPVWRNIPGHENQAASS